MYAQFMEVCLIEDELPNVDKDPRKAARVRKARKEAANTTRRSLTIGILELATSAPHLTTRIMTNMFEELRQLTAAEWDADSSTPASNDNFGSDDDEGAGNADSEISEVDDTNSLVQEKTDRDNNGSVAESRVLNGQKVCIDEPQLKRDPAKVEPFSIDDLLNEIERLTSLSPFHGLNLGTAADDACLHTTRPVTIQQTTTMLDVQDVKLEVETAVPRKPQFARVCAWALSRTAEVDVRLGFRSNASEVDDEDDEDDEDDGDVGRDTTLQDENEPNREKETKESEDEGAVSKPDGTSFQHASIAPTKATIQVTARDLPATDHEQPAIAEKLQDNERIYPDRPNTSLEDDGSFYMPCVCIALAKGNLDERRMQRLKDGFFALLNQTR